MGFGSIILLILLVVLSFSKKKVPQVQEQTQGNFDDTSAVFDDIEDKKDFINRKEEVKKENFVTTKKDTKPTQQKQETEKKQKSFDLRQAVIYSTILDRPYK
ncbi:MAG: hypothetical protein MJZ71_06140 [Bacteroidales bacterium]|nr:hypothetical protein [Bacteroidales bacterium]